MYSQINTNSLSTMAVRDKLLLGVTHTWDNYNMRSNSSSHRVFRAKHTHTRENTCHNARLAADNLDNVNSRATVAVQVQQ